MQKKRLRFQEHQIRICGGSMNELNKKGMAKTDDAAYGKLLTRIGT